MPPFTWYTCQGVIREPGRSLGSVRIVCLSDHWTTIQLENGDAKLHFLCPHPMITLAFYLLFIFLMEQFPTTAHHRNREASLGYKASGVPRNIKRGGRQLVREHWRELCACAVGSSEAWAAFHDVKQRRWLGRKTGSRKYKISNSRSLSKIERCLPSKYPE